MALPVYNVAAPEIPLLLNEKSSLFKLFLSDTGMLTSLYGRAVKMQLLSNSRDINNGAVYENAVARIHYVNIAVKLYGKLSASYPYQLVFPVPVRCHFVPCVGIVYFVQFYREARRTSLFKFVKAHFSPLLCVNTLKI